MSCKHNWMLGKNPDKHEKKVGFDLLAKCSKCDFYHPLNSSFKKFLQVVK